MPRTEMTGSPSRSARAETVTIEINGVRMVGRKESPSAADKEARRAERHAKRREAEAAVSDDGDAAWEDVKKSRKKSKSKSHAHSDSYRVGPQTQAIPIRSCEIRVGQVSGCSSCTASSAPTAATSPAPRPPTSSPPANSPAKGGFWEYVAKLGQKPLDPVRIGDDVYMMP